MVFELVNSGKCIDMTKWSQDIAPGVFWCIEKYKSSVPSCCWYLMCTLEKWAFWGHHSGFTRPSRARCGSGPYITSDASHIFLADGDGVVLDKEGTWSFWAPRSEAIADGAICKSVDPQQQTNWNSRTPSVASIPGGCNSLESDFKSPNIRASTVQQVAEMRGA